MEEAQHLLAQQYHVVMKNLFPHGQKLQAGSCGGNMEVSTQNEPLSDG
jgi:hypothetical protein